ncbi:MAG: DUF1330 domain-containing protein [Butyricicoccaceae bacterium]
MSCYFIVSTYLDAGKSRASYDDYIQLVAPIVARYGGKYLVRTEQLTPLSPLWEPDRLIVIRFPNRKQLDQCFASEKYRAIMEKRMCCTDSRAIIAEGVEYEDF